MFNQYPYINMTDLNLDFILKHINELIASIKDLDEWRLTHEEEYEELKALYDQIIAGNFPDSIKQAFADWMNANALDLVGAMVKNVYFAIDDNGYFVANIPESWSDIIFGTSGLDDFPPGVDFGHLTLTY